MACFNLGFAEAMLIWIVVIVGIYLFIELLLPLLGTVPRIGGFLVAALRILLWVIIAIIVIKLVFALLGCLLGSGPPFRLPR